jgi:hypothetical protein
MKLKDGDLMATIRGTARMRYLVSIEPKPTRPAPARDFIKIMGRYFPMRKKFMILKQVPRRRPFATSILPNNMKTIANAKEKEKARKEMRLWTCASSLCVFSILIFSLFNGIHDLAIGGVSSPRNAQKYEYGDEEPLCPKPLIEIVADSKAKKD